MPDRLGAGARGPGQPGPYRARPWLALAALAHNLARAAGTLASTFHARARTGTIRRHLIAVPARLAAGARTLTWPFPTRWAWRDALEQLWTAAGHRLRT